METQDVRRDILLGNLPRTQSGLPCAGSVVLHERLGKGGVGAVYLGFDQKLAAEVAVKVLNFEVAENVGAVERFLREARSTFRVDHTNLIRVLTVDEEAGTHYMVMEYVDGEAADERIRREGPVPERDALEIAAATGEALAAAHAQGILHRDVKPANIMLRYSDGRVKLADLGLAKALGREGAGVTGLTAEGQIMGTPAYMSPEQASDASSADERTDIYSLGATLYALIGGTPPFQATQLFDLLNKVMHQRPRDIRSLQSGVTQNTAAVMSKMMAKSALQRPQTMVQTVKLLRACLERAPTRGVRGLARPQMAGKRKIERTARDETADVGPPATPRPTRRIAKPGEDRTPTPALGPQETLEDRAMWQKAARERSAPAGVAPGAPVAPLAGRPSGGKKAAIALGIAVVLVAGVGAVGYALSNKGGAAGGGTTDLPPGVSPDDPRVPEVVKLLAAVKTFRETGLLEKARDKLAEVLSIMPEHEGAKRQLFEVKAMIGAKEALAQRKGEYRTWMDRGTELRLQRKLEEAALAYERAARFAPLGSKEAAEAAVECMVEHCRTRAEDAVSKGDFETAVGLYTKAIEKKDELSTRRALADARTRLEMRKAKLAGNAAVLSWLQRAQEEEGRGEREAALESYREAAELGADVATAIALLEGKYEDLERPTAAATPTGPGGVAPVARPETLMIDVGGGERIEMAYIEPGPFMMGSNDAGRDEKPVHEALIATGFYMGKHEVTQGQYEFVMRANPSHFKRRDLPVESVSWDEAVEFCEKVASRTGKAVRLPTEAEWEYAARAGSEGNYCFGDDAAALGGYAWYSSNSDKETHPVGLKRKNAWGLYDVHGNVYEWCADWYGPAYYAQSLREDPKGPPSGTARVLRGGSWSFGAENCRSACRNKYIPTGRHRAFGFRVAVTP